MAEKQIQTNCPDCGSAEIGKVVFESGEVDSEQVFCVTCDFVFSPTEGMK